MAEKKSNQAQRSVFDPDNPRVRAILPLIGLILMLALFTALTHGDIIQPNNLKLLLSQTYMLMIASIGVFFVMTMGCLDFSQGSLMGLACIAVCVVSRTSVILGILAGIAVGALIGAVNGWLHVYRQIPSFIVTMSTQYLFRGFVQFLTTKSPVMANMAIARFNTMPVMMGMTLVSLLIAFIFFRYTAFGANLKAIGASERGARFAGIKVTKTKFWVYVLAGAITGFAAFVNAIKVLSVTSTGGNQLETQILIGLVLGGMPISGGAKVRFSNIVIGVLMFRFLASGLVMVGLTTQMQQLIEGVVFVIMVTLFSDRKSLAVIK
jgi:ribose transport system permease protein